MMNVCLIKLLVLTKSHQFPWSFTKVLRFTRKWNLEKTMEIKLDFVILLVFKVPNDERMPNETRQVPRSPDLYFANRFRLRGPWFSEISLFRIYRPSNAKSVSTSCSARGLKTRSRPCRSGKQVRQSQGGELERFQAPHLLGFRPLQKKPTPLLYLYIYKKTQ